MKREGRMGSREEWRKRWIEISERKMGQRTDRRSEKKVKKTEKRQGEGEKEEGRDRDTKRHGALFRGGRLKGREKARE